jgi:hypothetical protein
LKVITVYELRRGSGRERDYYGLKRWLGERQIRLKVLAKELDVHPTVISQTIRGIMNNRKVLTKLQELGCPVDMLSLPKDMRPEHGPH